MKKTLRFAALAAVMALTSWLSMHPTVQAASLPSCTTIAGTSCNPAVNTGRAKCYWYQAAEPGFCTCDSTTSTWTCCCIS
jgi:hypothetical protein